MLSRASGRVSRHKQNFEVSAESKQTPPDPTILHNAIAWRRRNPGVLRSSLETPNPYDRHCRRPVSPS